LIPFCKVTAYPYHDPNPEPSIWVCNHTSALDIFILLAADLKLRGKNKRPLKIVYVSTK
jgi:1-acyl-sn-glycerol-3-phosphate acyltransferase